MAKGTSAPTRISADVAAAAASVAADEDRTIAEQINHWARIGLQIERAGSVASRRILEVTRGEQQFDVLSVEERVVAHALIDAAMADRVAEARFGPTARRSGQVTVSIDEDGALIEISADGTRRRL